MNKLKIWLVKPSQNPVIKLTGFCFFFRDINISNCFKLLICRTICHVPLKLSINRRWTCLITRYFIFICIFIFILLSKVVQWNIFKPQNKNHKRTEQNKTQFSEISYLYPSVTRDRVGRGRDQHYPDLTLFRQRWQDLC